MFLTYDQAIKDAKRKLGSNCEPGRHFKVKAHGPLKFSWAACYVDGMPFADEEYAIYIASLTARAHKRDVILIGRAGDRIVIHHKKIVTADGDTIHRGTARRLLREIAKEQAEADADLALLRKQNESKRRVREAMAAITAESNAITARKAAEARAQSKQLAFDLGPMPKVQCALFAFLPISYRDAAKQDRFEKESSVIRLAMRKGGATRKELDSQARDLGLIIGKRASFVTHIKGGLSKKYRLGVELEKEKRTTRVTVRPLPGCAIAA
jgi:hypothetical protein